MTIPARLAILVLSLSLTACGEEEFARPADFPDSHVENAHFGAIYQRTAVTTEDRAVVHWVGDIAEGYTAPRVVDVPAQLIPSSLGSSCRLPKPSSGARIVLVEIFAGYDVSPLYLFTESDVDGLRAPGQARGEGGAEGSAETQPRRQSLGQMLQTSAARPVDVFVTETERPVYLVLAAHAETLWSLQIAEGVTLDGVAVVGHGPQAVAHPPLDVTRIGFTVYDDSPQSNCMEKPHRTVNNDTWSAVILSTTSAKHAGFKDVIRKARRNGQLFRDWLTARVGQFDRTVGALHTSHVLIGPKPAAPIPYRSLAGARIAYSPNATPLWGHDWQVKDLVTQLAER